MASNIPADRGNLNLRRTLSKNGGDDMRKIDLTGREFGALIVLREDADRNEQERDRAVRGEIAHSKLYWVCKCSKCGSIATYCGDNLRSGNTTSCWACRSNKISDGLKKSNAITTNGAHAVVTARNTGSVFTFDLCDAEMLAEHCWHETKYGYLATRIRGYGIVFAHRMIMFGLQDIRNDMVVDHINGDRKDCRRINMRVCTAEQNGWNRHAVRSKSGIIGVYPIPDSGKWRASIRANGRVIDLGRFGNIDEARAARVAAEKQYYGEFAPI